MVTSQELLEEKLAKLTESEKAVWEVFVNLGKKQGFANLKSFCEAQGADWRTASMYMERFAKMGLLQKSDNILDGMSGEGMRYRVYDPGMKVPPWKMVRELDDKELADFTLEYIEKMPMHRRILLEIAKEQAKDGFATVGRMLDRLPIYDWTSLCSDLRFMAGDALILETAYDSTSRMNRYTLRSKQAPLAIMKKYKL